MAYRPSESGMFNPTSVMTPHADDAEGFSVIDRHSQFDGVFTAKRDLRIEGEVKGTIECQGTLFIAQGAVVAAHVEAENITVAGDLSGEVACRGRLQIMPSGRLRGKVQTRSLVVNEGAYYEGDVEMPAAAAAIAASTPTPRALPGTLTRPVITAPTTPAPVAAPERPAAPPVAPAPKPAPAASPAPAAATTPPADTPRTFIRRFGGPETAWGNDEAGDSKDEA